MVTRAGRLRKKTSQGWPSSSASRTRPIRMPSATPRLMAIDEARRHPQQRDREIQGQLAGGGIGDDLGQHRRRRRHQARVAGEPWRRPATRPAAPAATEPGSARGAACRHRRPSRSWWRRLPPTARLRAMGLSSSPSARRCRGPAPCPCRPASRRRARPGRRTAWRLRPAAPAPNARRSPRGSGA